MDFNDVGINTRNRTAGQMKTKCPKCGGKFDLSVNLSKGIWKCHKPSCNWIGTINERRKHPEVPYIKPAWSNITELSDAVVKWFKKRGISQTTLIAAKVTDGIEFMPQTQQKKNTIKFNYFRDQELINIKFRDGSKNFKLVSGAELIFYNIDSLIDQKEIIITEGEIDCLSYIEAGITNVVSVPNGASKGEAKLNYLDNCWEYFDNVEKVYVAVDNDEAGRNLSSELLRRIGIDKCFIVDFKDCKDANEYLIKHGVIALADTIEDAVQPPIQGVVYAEQIRVEIEDLYEHGLKPGAQILIPSIDELISYELGRVTVITGIPSHGKSTWLDFVQTKLSIIHKWPFGVFSPENFPIKIHIVTLMEQITGKKFGMGYDMTKKDRDEVLKFINGNMYFIHPEEEGFNLDNILKVSKSLVLKHGIKAVIMDPWNKLNQQVPIGVSQTNYISQELDKICYFAQRSNVHVFLVAHPTKIKKKENGLYEVPSLYDIADSAHFYNKCDAGISVYRDFKENVIRIYVQKIKFKHLGKIGMAEFIYDTHCGRYTPINAENNRTNYLAREYSQQQLTIENNHHPDKFTTPLVEAKDLDPF